MYKGKIVPLTKEQADKLENTGTPVNEVLKDMSSGEQAPFRKERNEKFLQPLLEQSVQSLGTGWKKNYIFFARKKGI